MAPQVVTSTPEPGPQIGGTVDEVRVHPETRLGDPFLAAASGRQPHACNHGWISMGVESEEGETEEVLYLCRICVREREES